MLAADLDDEVHRLGIAIVVDAVELIGSAVDGASCGDGHGRGIGDELQRALAQEHQLGVRMAVRRVGSFAGIEFGLVDFDVGDAWDQAVEDLVAGDAGLAGVAGLGGDPLAGGER